MRSDVLVNGGPYWSLEHVRRLSVESTMIYTQVLNKGGRRVTSPLDRGYCV